MTDLVDIRSAFLRTVKDQLAPEIDDHDLEYFGLAAQRLDLSPFTQPPQIVAIPRYDKRLKRKIHRPQVTVDGRLTLAMRSGKVVAIGEGEWCGPSDSKNGKPPVWVGFWDDDGTPHGARSTIWLAGTDTPSRAVVRWAEFAQYDSEGTLLEMWRKMPAHMLHKVALALNLRRAVPDILPKDLILYTESDAETAKQDHTIVEDDGTTMICSCGEKFVAGGAHYKHRMDALEKIPGPAGGDPAAQRALGGATAGPGPKTYKARKPRPIETGPPVDYYDNLPEARNMK